jgi:hypothetical protein
MKVSQNKTFVFSSTKNFSNSIVNDGSKNTFTMMLSYASNFRPNSTKYAEQLNQDQTQRAIEQAAMNSQLNKFDDFESEAPSKISGPKDELDGEMVRTKSEKTSRSNLKSPMSRTGSSFNRVRFKDQVEVNEMPRKDELDAINRLPRTPASEL